MGKEYAPWSEARPTISHAVKKPELTLLREEFNSPGNHGGIAPTISTCQNHCGWVLGVSTALRKFIPHPLARPGLANPGRPSDLSVRREQRRWRTFKL